MLAKKKNAWCVAYPDSSKQKFYYAWINFSKEQGLQPEVRIMKHRLDLAISYLEKNLIKGNSTQKLQKDFAVELVGPLLLKKPEEKMRFSTFTHHGQSFDSHIGSLINLPKGEKKQQAFQQSILGLANMITKEQMQQQQDIIYIPARRD